ncbi:hypothetical protein DL763_007112 [Monosporascus cannonballus]|nr:hypothetical protein DL763_007112 [Monosporascus cannonballus]
MADEKSGQAQPGMASSGPLVNGVLPATPKSQEPNREELPLKEPLSEAPDGDDNPNPDMPSRSAGRGVRPRRIHRLDQPDDNNLHGITPMVIGSLADSAGRRPAYCICFFVYIAANIGCALAPNYKSLLALRTLQSAGSSSTVAPLPGCRGRHRHVRRARELRGVHQPALPSRAFYRSRGWRRTHAVPRLALDVLAARDPSGRRVRGQRRLPARDLPLRHLRRLGPPTSGLPHAVAALEGLVRAAGKGSPVRGHRGEGGDEALSAGKPSSLPRKEKKFNVFRSPVLLFEAEMFLLLVYGAVLFAGIYAVMASMGTRRQAVYGLSGAGVGLLCLPVSGGMLLSAAAVGRALDWNYRRHDRTGAGDFPIERARCGVGAPPGGAEGAAIAAWGWVLHRRAPLVAPCVLLALLSFGVAGFSNTLSALITDLNPGDAAATATLDPLIDAGGLGWAFVLFGGPFAVLSPSMWLAMRNGAGRRRAKAERRRFKRERKAGGGDGETGPQET